METWLAEIASSHRERLDPELGFVNVRLMDTYGPVVFWLVVGTAGGCPCFFVGIGGMGGASGIFVSSGKPRNVGVLLRVSGSVQGEVVVEDCSLTTLMIRFFRGRAAFIRSVKNELSSLLW